MVRERRSTIALWLLGATLFALATALVIGTPARAGMQMPGNRGMASAGYRSHKYHGLVYHGMVTPAQRKRASRRAAAARLANPLGSLLAPAAAAMPLATPDYFGPTPNYANSQLAVLDANGAVVPGTGIRKFVDSLPGLGAANANDLGQYIPVAVPDTTTYPGSDYYEISLVQYTERLHADLPPTTLRGYVQTNTSDPTVSHPSYLGPIILAQANRPVRVKFTNALPTGAGGDLFLPVDTTVMGAGMGPNGGSEMYTQNRAVIHLHGGATPWISDGTPHQWITPAGETTSYPKGVSVTNVPDMWFDASGHPVPAGTPGATNDPGPGSTTYFYTNQQSARLMFYHDHSFGMTRLNVYAGEAAGYLLSDPVEQELISGNLDKPPAARKIAQDVKPGTIPADQIPLVIQDKTFVPDPTQLAAEDPTWDTANWGGRGNLWFPHVYMPNQNPYDDSGANGMGRWDYGPWFWPPLTTSAGLAHGEVANPYYDPVNAPWEPPMIPGTPNPSLVPEAFMDTTLVNGTAYPYLKVDGKAYRFRILNACNDRTLNLQLYFAKSNTPAAVDGSGNPTLQTDSGEVSMVPAVPHPNDPTWPSTWPTDGRDGGVPDPTTVGPHMVQIGTEGGLLPQPVVIDSTPIGYNYNRRDIVVLNVQNHSIMLGPAERADVVIDFSGVPNGSKLILYNDAPAPVPAFDPRYDYYTGDPDMTAMGGAPTTPAGYGPNTRTLLQFQVVKTASAPPMKRAGWRFQRWLTSLQSALPAAYALTQAPPIVPEKAYGDATNTYVRIQNNSVRFTPRGQSTPITMPLQPKAIQELFELDYGRMNATLGVELPFTNFNTQTTIPLGYHDPLTEVIGNSDKMTPIGSAGDGTQIWKITHNGVDTHAIHFHLFNVQLINRVGWDGAIRPPDPNEVGWEETVRMNPLEDAIVALRPVAPSLPFKIGDSVRPLDPTVAVGAPLTLTNPADGNPITVPNDMTNFGWEYVWHCHLLGHEENDMMRPIEFQVSPAKPSGLTATSPPTGTNPPSVTLNWSNNATTPAATDFLVQRATDAAFTANLATFAVPGSATTYTDTPLATHSTFYYRVRAENAISYSAWSGSANATTAGRLPTAPTGLAVTGTTSSSISVSWTNPGGGAPVTGIRVQRSTAGAFGPWTTAATVSATTTAYTLTGLAGATGYWIRVQAFNADGSAASNVAHGTTN